MKQCRVSSWRISITGIRTKKRGNRGDAPICRLKKRLFNAYMVGVNGANVAPPRAYSLTSPRRRVAARKQQPNKPIQHFLRNRIFFRCDFFPFVCGQPSEKILEKKSRKKYRSGNLLNTTASVPDDGGRVSVPNGGGRILKNNRKGAKT